VVSSLGSVQAELNLKSGELLGDSISGRSISVTSVVGTTNISNGVFGVLLSSSGESWTLQVRNLDGNVTFTGADGLDSSSMAVAIVDAGKSVNVPVGEEFVARGSYNAETDVFALSSGGAVIAMMSDDTTSGMRQQADKMAAFGTTPVAGQEVPAEVIIEIPWREVETASEIR
ncbi:MAG TPA: hypothetical protein VK995_03360, partial [Oceanipulchritudo sp.]|nr:hypothetical protein [Oceanipulchritudo sp.]